MVKNGIHFELNDKELRIFKSNYLASGFDSQTDFIKSKILYETKEEHQEITDLLLNIKEQIDMMQKILLSTPLKSLQKQEWIIYALLVHMIMRIEMKNRDDKEKKEVEEEVYELIENAKQKSDEIFGKDE